MRIELNVLGKNSLKGQIKITEFAASYAALAAKQKRVAGTFKVVGLKTQYLSGGVGNLEPALADINKRIQDVEQKKSEKIETAGQRLALFITNTINTDNRVSQIVKASNDKFYQANPWAVPPKPKKWWQKLRDCFVSIGKKIGNAFKKAASWIADKLKKAWNATVKFLKDHYKTILKIVGGAVLIAGLFALSAVTGGAAAGVFALAAKAALTAALTGTATSVVTGIAQGKSAGEIFDSAGDSFFKGAVTGAISGAVGGVGPAVLEATGSQFFAKGAQILAEGVGNFLGGMITEGADYLAENGTLSGFFSGYWQHGGMNALTGMANSALGFAGDYLKGKAAGWLGKAWDAFSDSSLGKSLNGFVNDIKDSASWLVGENGILGKVGLNSWGDVANAFKNPSEFLQNLGGDLMKNIFGTNSVSDLISSGLSQLSDALGVKDFLDNLSLSGIMDALDLPGISDIADALNLPDLSQIMNVSDLMNGLGDAKNILLGFKDSVINTSKEALNTICGSGFADAISSSIKPVQDFASSALDFIKNDNPVSNLGKSVANTVSDGIGSIAGALGF